MANAYKRTLNRVTTTVTTLYTCPVNTEAIILSFNVANTSGIDITVGVKINDGSSTYAIVPVDTIVRNDTGMTLIGEIQKIVLNSGDSLEVISNTTSSADAIVSVLEIT